jgi:hypothetical protein
MRRRADGAGRLEVMQTRVADALLGGCRVACFAVLAEVRAMGLGMAPRARPPLK